MLCEDMIYVSSLYMAQNELSLKILEVKNNDALNEARKVLYRAIIYLEDLVSNFIDVSYSELAEKYEAISHISLEKRYYISRKLGLAINLLEEAFGENSKWKWSFVELKGRFAVVAKNLLDMRTHAKDYFDPNSPLYETAVQYVRMVNQLLESSASGYRDKYELSTRRLDDMRNAIKFLLARHKIAMAIGDKSYAEEDDLTPIEQKNKEFIEGKLDGWAKELGVVKGDYKDISAYYDEIIRKAKIYGNIDSAGMSQETPEEVKERMDKYAKYYKFIRDEYSKTGKWDLDTYNEMIKDKDLQGYLANNDVSGLTKFLKETLEDAPNIYKNAYQAILWENEDINKEMQEKHKDVYE